MHHGQTNFPGSLARILCSFHSRFLKHRMVSPTPLSFRVRIKSESGGNALRRYYRCRDVNNLFLIVETPAKHHSLSFDLLLRESVT